MNVRPYNPADELEEQEPFALDGLGGYSLKQELTAKLLGNEECCGLYAAARARGLLPPLLAGKVAFDAAQSECSAFASLLSPRLSDLLEPLPIAYQGRHVRWRCAT